MFNKKLKKVVNQFFHKKGYHLAPYKGRGLTGADWEHDFSHLIQYKNPVCLDVGANLGQTIDDFHAWFDEPIIYAFEPSTEIFAQLEARKANEAGWDNTHLYKIALGDKAGDATLHNYENGFLNSLLELEDTKENPFRGDIQREKNTETVAVGTVDQFLQDNQIEHLDLLKMDTQGFDLQVLKGAEQSLKAGKIQFVFLEMNFVSMYKGQGGAAELMNYLAQFNQKVIGFYDIYRPVNQYNIAWTSTLFGRCDEA